MTLVERLDAYEKLLRLDKPIGILLLLWPCLVLTVTILFMNYLCDSLRDWLDPHARPVRRRFIDRMQIGRAHV